MRLLQYSNIGDLMITNFVRNDIPHYAILSHRWLDATEEPTFEDLTKGTGQGKPGYEKLRFCGEQARQNGLKYFWVDTCCINKADSSELSQAINSMFRWYRDATRCYVYLSDVSTNKRKSNVDSIDTWDSEFRRSKWFTRG
jgi:Heterokaryon incompatibility protein (HET)